MGAVAWWGVSIPSVLKNLRRTGSVAVAAMLVDDEEPFVVVATSITPKGGNRIAIMVAVGSGNGRNKNVENPAQAVAKREAGQYPMTFDNDQAIQIRSLVSVMPSH